MGIQLTVEETTALMSLYRQFEFPNYDHNCRAEEDWLKHPERRKALYSARAKILSPEAKTPNAVVQQAPATPAPATAPKPPVVDPAGTTAQRLDTTKLVTEAPGAPEEPAPAAVALSSMPAAPAAPAETPAPAAPAAQEAPKVETTAPAPKQNAPSTGKKK